MYLWDIIIYRKCIFTVYIEADLLFSLLAFPIGTVTCNVWSNFTWRTITSSGNLCFSIIICCGYIWCYWIGMKSITICSGYTCTYVIVVVTLYEICTVSTFHIYTKHTSLPCLPCIPCLLSPQYPLCLNIKLLKCVTFDWCNTIHV